MYGLRDLFSAFVVGWAAMAVVVCALLRGWRSVAVCFLVGCLSILAIVTRQGT